MPLLFAALLRKQHQIGDYPTDEQIDALLAAVGLPYSVEPLAGRLKDVYVSKNGVKRLYLNSNLPREWLRWLKLHAVVHHLCHSSCQPLMLYIENNQHLAAKEERHADLGAGYLAWGHLLKDNGQACAMTDQELAEAAEMPVKCVGRWHDLCLEDARLVLGWESAHYKRRMARAPACVG